MLAKVIAYDIMILHWQMLLPTFIVSYWFMTDFIVKDYGYSFISQLADVIAFIVCGRCEPHVNTYSIWKVLSETELKFCSRLTSFRSQTLLLLLVCLGKCYSFEYPKKCCSIQFRLISIIMVYICSKML